MCVELVDNTWMIDKVSSDDVQLDNVVAEWVSLYREDRVEALRKLVNFMIRVSLFAIELKEARVL